MKKLLVILAVVLMSVVIAGRASAGSGTGGAPRMGSLSGSQETGSAGPDGRGFAMVTLNVGQDRVARFAGSSVSRDRRARFPSSPRLASFRSFQPDPYPSLSDSERLSPSCRGSLDRGANRVEIPQSRGLRGLRLQMVEVAFPPQEVHDPRRVRGRAGRPGRVVVRDVERMRSRDLDRFLDEA